MSRFPNTFARSVAALCATLALSLSASSTLAQNVAVTNATVALGDGSDPIENATVVVRNGRVVSAGVGVGVPAGMTAIDGSGMWVTPGLFAAATTIGLWDVGAVSSSNDQDADDSRFGAALDVTDALNPASQHVSITRGGGVTRGTVYSAPSGFLFGGQGAVVDFSGNPQMVTKPRSFQMIALGEAGARIAGGSRTASYAELRSALAEARAAANGTWEEEGAELTEADANALAKVIRGEQSLYVVVHRASDIRRVLGLKRRYSQLDLVLVGAAEGWLVASEIAAADVPVITNPIDNLPVSFAQLGATQSNVGRMVDAGVRVAIGTLGNGIEQPRNITQFAGNLVALDRLPQSTGLTWAEAFAAITSVPAEISGMGGELGVLSPGAIGDLVIWDGDPLELSSAATRIFIEGVEYPVSNHQTRLRDRYRDLDESDLPKGYDW